MGTDENIYGLKCSACGAVAQDQYIGVIGAVPEGTICLFFCTFCRTFWQQTALNTLANQSILRAYKNITADIDQWMSNCLNAVIATFDELADLPPASGMPVPNLPPPPPTIR